MRGSLLGALLVLIFGWINSALVLADPPAPPQTLAIGRVVKAPTLDGHMDDWPVAARFLLGQASQTLRRPGRWDGTADSSAAIRLAWDDQFLYLGADVVDDRLMQAGGGAEPWQGDTLELLFNIYPGQQRVDGFWQIALIPPVKAGEKLRVVGPQKDFVGVEGTAVVHEGGYTLECRIPWKNLDGFKPVVNAHLGFQIMLDDRDDNGRKSQLVWYPSAITFAHPMDMNTLILKPQPQTDAAAVLGGPATAVVTDPKTMKFSVLADIDGADHAVVEAVMVQPTNWPQKPDAQSNRFEPVTVKLRKIGDRVAVGAGAFDVETLDGPAEFSIQVFDASGQAIGFGGFKTELAGTRYRTLVDSVKSCQARVKALRDSVDPADRAGVAGQVQRLADMIPNEARPETVSADLLRLMTLELASTVDAITKLEQGLDVFPGRSGSMIRAYKSPLTDAFRTYALHVPCGTVAPEADGEAKPLMVVLHPIFADERFLLMAPPALRETGAIVYQGAGYRQLDWSSVNAAETRAGLDDVLQHYKVDPDRIYLIGVHIGGRGVLQLSMMMPDVFAAIAPLYPGIDTKPPYPALRLYPQYFDQASDVQIPAPQFKPIEKPQPITDPIEIAHCQMLSLATTASNIAGIPIRAAYGEDDPDAAAERLALVDALRDLGSDFPARYAPGAMHGIMPQELGDPAFYRWLLAQRRPFEKSHELLSTTTMRDNLSWWVRIDQMESPAKPAVVEAWVDGSHRLNVKTSGVTQFLLFPNELAPDRINLAWLKNLYGNLNFRLVPGRGIAGEMDATSIVIDGQIVSRDQGHPVKESLFALDEQKHWKADFFYPGHIKRHGISGPIDDFQFDRFLVVYGTGGSVQEQVSLKKIGQSIADWGLGTTFQSKADKDVTEDDFAKYHILAVGTPDNNSVLKQLSGTLPLKWQSDSLTLGGLSVKGPGTGACMIFPNPKVPTRYLVVITGLDPAGYEVWTQRTGWDYVLGHSVESGGKSHFVSTARGWFNNQWAWTADLASTKENP